ncbi:ribonuclease P protein subunit p20-like isoform X1 [Schistocerca piceifrons]|uniref:ribonuclease P protein subunit p20-like isoform X1 n=1 Tax=Schistocerca piceifrons TaxID=274613 RepID=UPI001F5EA96E|nr:ribonuclease P protein subunit p20-like isoform X1 [Schistocerca piceifrons]XP_047121516.1 ribonuclease P protein subunit p20-like isoform X1 [Schistocerca piceifrons]
MADAGVTDVVQWKKRERPKLNNDHVLRKRLPPRLPRRKQDIYITNKSNYKGQLARSEKLLESGEPEIVIHGLGAAVTRAVNLALQLKEKFLGTVELSVNTSTVDIVGWLTTCVPLCDTEEESVKPLPILINKPKMTWNHWRTTLSTKQILVKILQFTFVCFG